MTPAVIARGEWPLLARVARHMLAAREAGYPAMVARSRMTQAQADDGLATMRAVVTIWDAVLARADIPDDLGTTWRAMHLDLEAAAQRAEQHPPKDTLADFVACVAALAWHMRPVSTPPTTEPHIVFVHRLNQMRRATCATETGAAA